MIDLNAEVEADSKLADLLLGRGKIDQAGLERAWRWRKENGQRLSAIITSLGMMTERDMAETLAEFLQLPIVKSDDYPDDVTTGGALSERFLKEARVLPLSETEDSIALAMADPLDDFSKQAVALKSGKRVTVSVAVPSEIEEAVERLFGDGGSSLDQIVESIGDDGEFDDDEERLRDLASEAPVIRLVNLIISKSVESRASDVHVEPFENRLRVRYRIDGVLHEVDSPPSRLRHAVISRIKIMAKLNIAEHRLPQDGRIKLVVRGKEVDLRVSCLPTMYGESVVLRILDQAGGVLGLSRLGFDDAILGDYNEVLSRPNGIILVTGPTGSGKTTTLYASLMSLNGTEKKIVTVEDPIEYRLEGVNQIQVKPQIGLGFADVLRSILRHDPDTIMVGEIRDIETAQIAVQAALTGHLVLSTLHTNTAAATVTRLLDMGVEDYLLTSTICGIVSQRLVRTLCPRCKRSYKALPEFIDQLQLRRMTNDEHVTLYEPVGCGHCNDSGYRGRSVIAEFLLMSDAIQSLVLKHADSREIHRRATDLGMRTMYEDGLRQALSGLTSIDEILRVTREN